MKRISKATREEAIEACLCVVDWWFSSYGVFLEHPLSERLTPRRISLLCYAACDAVAAVATGTTIVEQYLEAAAIPCLSDCHPRSL